MCWNAQINPKKCNFSSHIPQTRTFWNSSFEIWISRQKWRKNTFPHIWTFSQNLKFLMPGLTHRHKNCTRQTSECADQLLLQAIDKFFYFVLIKYLVENKLQNRHAFWAHLSHLIYTKTTLVLIRIWAIIPFMEVYIHFQLRTRDGGSIFRTSTMIRRNWNWRSLHRRHSCSNRRVSILKWCLNLWGVSKKQTKWKWDHSMFWNGNWVRPTF